MERHTRLPLCVTSWHLRLPSETFVLRHQRDLLPGRTLCFGIERGTESDRREATEFVAAESPSSWVSKLLARFPGGKPTWSAKLESELARHGCDAILGEYLNHSFTFFKELPAQSGLRLFAHAHGYDISLKLREKNWAWNYRRLADRATIISPSIFAQNLLVEHGIPRGRIIVIPYGTTFPPASMIPTRSQLGEARVRFLAVGRLVGKKAPHLLIEAFRRTLADCPGGELTIIGDGPLAGLLETAIRETGLEGRVKLLGRQPHDVVLQNYRTHDVFVQHSIVDPDTGDMEGLPVSILEAMAWGLPVVSTIHAGIPEAVVSGETGLLVKEQDIDSMAASMVALARDPSRRWAMGEKGRARLETRFAWDVEKASLLKLIFPDGVPD
jgi:glycosyltransferase involved in cell wall biosynthesis